MIVINGKTYRNLEEQVQKNKEDIEALSGGGGGTAEVTGTTIAAHTNSTTTIVSQVGSNGNVEYNLATPVATKIDNSLQLPSTGLGKTELVGIGVNNEQVNIEIDTNTLNITNNKLSVIGGSTGGVTKEYVDAQDEKLHQSITTTDSQVQKLNEEVTTIKTDSLPKKLDKMTGTGTGVQAYVNQNGVDRLLNATSDKTRELIVRWDSNAQLHANAGTTDDAVVNKKQLDDAIANKLDKATTTSGSYAYCRNGNRDETIPVNSLVGTDAIVRRTSTGTIKANAGVDQNDCVNKKQLDDAIAGVSGSAVTKEYVDNGLAGKLDKIENTSTNTQCYVNQAGTNRLLNTSSDVTRQLIVRWDNAGRLHSNAATTGDEVVNKEQLDAAIAGVSGGAQLNVANTWTATQTFNASNSYVDTTGHVLIPLFDMNVGMQEAPQTYKIGQLTIADDSAHENYIERYDLFLYKNQQSKHILLDNGSVGKGLEYVTATNRINISHPVVQITQAAYDGLTTKDSATLYVIVG